MGQAVSPGPSTHMDPTVYLLNAEMSTCLYDSPAGELYACSHGDCLSPCPVKGLFLVVTDKVLVS